MIFLDASPRLRAHVSVALRDYTRRLRRDGVDVPGELIELAEALMPYPSMSYKTAHDRVKAARGPASKHGCAHCDSQAAHWAYDHSDPHQVAWLNPKGVCQVYSTDPDRYLPLCPACHKKFDVRERWREVVTSGPGRTLFAQAGGISDPVNGTPAALALRALDAAALLGCSVRQLRRKTASGEIPSLKDGRSRRYRPEDLAAYVASKVNKRHDQSGPARAC